MPTLEAVYQLIKKTRPKCKKIYSLVSSLNLYKIWEKKDSYWLLSLVNHKIHICLFKVRICFLKLLFLQHFTILNLNRIFRKIWTQNELEWFGNHHFVMEEAVVNRHVLLYFFHSSINMWNRKKNCSVLIN